MKKKLKAKIRYNNIRDNNIKLIKEHLKVEYLECNRCDNHKEIINFGFFDFHHINPEDKISSISYLMGHKNTVKLLKEVDKCEILCPSCHRLHHLKEKENEEKEYEQKLFEINILN